jgi:hypothetical protein
MAYYTAFLSWNFDKVLTMPDSCNEMRVSRSFLCILCQVCSLLKVVSRILARFPLFRTAF